MKIHKLRNAAGGEFEAPAQTLQFWLDRGCTEIEDESKAEPPTAKRSTTKKSKSTSKTTKATTADPDTEE